MRTPVTSICLFLIVSIGYGCNNGTQTDASREDSSNLQTVQGDSLTSDNHTPGLALSTAGDFNGDGAADTASLHTSSTSQKYLEIKHGGKGSTIVFSDGKVLGTDFGNFNWVEEMNTIPKGTVIFPNVIDDEIVSEEQVPAGLKTKLKTDAIFLHVSEASGGGIVHWKNGKYVWVQQD
jgi:hypothetical protein